MTRHAAIVGVLGALFVSPNLLVPLNTYDAGLSASAGTFLAHGQLPYRDFWWLYGPAIGMLSALVTAPFGPSLLLLRLLGLVVIGAQASVTYLVVRQRAPHIVAAVVAIAAVGATSFVNGLELSAWSLALPLALTALALRQSGRGLAAGVFLGITFVTRLDVGAYALVACLVLPHRRRLFGGFLLVAAPFGLVALATTPFPDLVQQLVWYPLVGTRQFRYVPAPAAEDLISGLLVLDLVLIPKIAVVLAAVVALARRPADRALVPLIVFAAFSQLQTVSRGDLYHQAQAAIPGLALIGLLAGPSAIPSRLSLPPRARLVRTGTFAGLAVTAASCLLFGAFSVLRMQTAPMPASDAAFVAGIRTVEASTAANEPIFVGLTQNRVTLLNPMLLYYLADRQAGTWGTMYNPGITNTDASQARMARELETSGTAVLYLDDVWAHAAEATNDSAIPGSTILDDFIGAHFVVACDYGSARVMATPERAGQVRCAQVRPEERLVDVLGAIRP